MELGRLRQPPGAGLLWPLGVPSRCSQAGNKPVSRDWGRDGFRRSWRVFLHIWSRILSPGPKGAPCEDAPLTTNLISRLRG